MKKETLMVLLIGLGIGLMITGGVTLVIGIESMRSEVASNDDSNNIINQNNIATPNVENYNENNIEYAKENFDAPENEYFPEGENIQEMEYIDESSLDEEYVKEEGPVSPIQAFNAGTTLIENIVLDIFEEEFNNTEEEPIPEDFETQLENTIPENNNTMPETPLTITQGSATPAQTAPPETDLGETLHPPEEVSIFIPQNATATQMSQMLYDNEIVDSQEKFHAYIDYYDKTRLLHHGNIIFEKNSTYEEALTRLLTKPE
ncbi:MAG: hypothetical protein ATN36_06350 [Epulopiscium sp. Nele67-Bin005]|nr:MAG: hypothetical protein ATN36_06350 [Epulopiscium sp. Nele67-Bin005]